MSKKLVCLVLAMLMLATIALAEGLPSRTVLQPTVLVTNGAEIDFEGVEPEAAAAQMADTLNTWTAIVEGDVAFSVAEQEAAEELGYDLAKMVVESAVITPSFNLKAGEDSTAEFATMPELATYPKIAAFLNTKTADAAEVAESEEGTGLTICQVDVDVDCMTVHFPPTEGGMVSLTFVGFEE